MLPKTDTVRKKVLILCTGNSCRSQIAEAIVNHFLGGYWQAYSAGTHPAGFVHPMALKALSEIGIHHTGESKSVERFREESFDAVITVCDDASENCPVWLRKGKPSLQQVHIGFPDPAKAEGNEEEKMAIFRQVREDIRIRILDYLRQYPAAVVAVLPDQEP